jgi:hypothetical protein
MYSYRGGTDVDEWVQYGAGQVNSQVESIGQFKDNEIEAGVLYYYYNGVSIHASIFVCPGKKMTKTFLKSVFIYPFFTLGLQKIVASVNSYNIPSINFLEKVGFKLEATLKGTAMYGGDLLYYTMDKNHCKWIEEN